MFKTTEILLNDNNLKIKDTIDQSNEPKSPISIRVFCEPYKITQIHIHHYDKNFNRKSYTIDDNIINMVSFNFKHKNINENTDFPLFSSLSSTIDKLNEKDIQNLKTQYDSYCSIGIPEAKTYNDYINHKIVFNNLEEYLLNLFICQLSIYLSFLKLYQEGAFRNLTDMNFNINQNTNSLTSKNYMKYIRTILKPIYLTSTGYLNTLILHCINFINFWETYMYDGIDINQFMNEFNSEYNNYMLTKNMEILNQQKYMIDKIQLEMQKLEKIKNEKIKKLISEVLENDFIEENVYVIE